MKDTLPNPAAEIAFPTPRLDDMENFARLLKTYQPKLRAGVAEIVIEKAKLGYRHVRTTGKNHPQFGRGCIMEIARSHPKGADPEYRSTKFSDPDYCAAFQVAVSAVMAAAQERLEAGEVV